MTDALHTVIGDLVGSRRVADRSAVQRALDEALDEVNAALAPAQPFEPTVGDEFQGVCDNLVDATRATLLARLRLLPLVDSRCGLGFGDVTVHDESADRCCRTAPAGGRRGRRSTWSVLAAAPAGPLTSAPRPVR